jgi:hypothetical protein
VVAKWECEEEADPEFEQDQHIVDGKSLSSGP